MVLWWWEDYERKLNFIDNYDHKGKCPSHPLFCEGVHDDVHDDGSAHLKLSTIKIKADDDDEGEYDDDDDDDNDDDDDCDDDYREEASTLL